METSDPFSKLDLRVAKIIEVNDHPQADKLYIMKIDIGPLGMRTIVAGMKAYYSKEDLIGKSIVVVINLKPATIRGIESKGMLLAAEDDQGVVSLLNPKNANPGAEIFVDAIPREPADILEFDDFKQVNLSIGEKLEVQYNGKSLMTKENIIVSDKEVKIGAEVK